MPAHVTPRNLLGDARMDLAAQHDDLEFIVAAIRDFDHAYVALRAHIMRRSRDADLKRRMADQAIDEAQEVLFGREAVAA